MATYLWQLKNELNSAMAELEKQRDEKYPNSAIFRDFANVKKWDLEDFNSVLKNIPSSAFMPDVVKFLKTKGDRRFLGMAMRGKDYFKVTQKILKKIEIEQIQ